jgi:hypothetical protein
MRALALCLVVAAAALAVTAEPASACSCAIVDAREALGRFDGALIGTVIERKDASQDGVTFVFRVEERFKGDLGATVDVRTPSNSAACGIEAPLGTRMGLFLERESGRWVGTLCSQVEPARLREAARPLPAPDGNGPVALLVGGRFGAARLLALDARGRTLAYGAGAGTVSAVSPCPGGRRVVEVAQTGTGLVLATRALPTLRHVRRRQLTSPAGPVPGAVRCANASGTEVIVFSAMPDAPETARLERLTATGRRVLWTGTALSASLTDRLAYVNAGPKATALLAVDLRTRAVTRLGRLPAFTGPLVPGAGGKRLAGIASDLRSTSPSRLVVVTTGKRPAAVRTAPLGPAGVTGDLFWLPGSRLAVFPHYDTVPARVYDARLRVVSRFGGWRAQRAALVGSDAFGLSFGDGRLLRARLPAGPVRVVRRLPSPVTYVIASVV